MPTIIEQGNKSNEDQTASTVRYKTDEPQTGEGEVVAYRSDDSGKLLLFIFADHWVDSTNTCLPVTIMTQKDSFITSICSHMRNFKPSAMDA